MKQSITKKKLFSLLKLCKISFIVHDHSALHTVKESELKRGNITGLHTKNLFFKNKKNEYFLFSSIEDQKFDLKKISKILKLGNISFAKEERLDEILSVKAGSVTPFGLLNDKDRCVKFFLDSKIYESDIVNFHPLVNTSTITLKVNDLINFFTKNNIKVNIFDFKNNTIIKQ